MDEVKLELDGCKTAESTTEMTKPKDKLPWETPKLEDVSEQVMAQPYIRFT